MTNWKPMDNAPRDGRPVLLWARLKSVPPGSNDHSPIVGFWNKSIDRWEATPDLSYLGSEVLIPKYLTELPEPPKS